ncbi:c-type cytochrome [Methylibium petroleiphilum]|uniref:c-type cytochrome n=1 Tax=Methylibium petroleiphilum TaxID=105560 RepID=UPI001AC47098|nr:cytochrome c [Methylibium petroleiphilum]MBN9202880.1 cytochrome c [Methylibium petroleiphilum]
MTVFPTFLPTMRLPSLRRPLAALLVTALPCAALAFGPGGPGASAPAAGTPAATTAPAELGAADLERQGSELFGRNCQLCHNSRGKGGKGPQLIKGAWGPGGANSDDYMFGIIKNGRPNTQMGGFGGALSDGEIRVIIAFLRAESVRVKAAERKAADADYVPW